MIPTIDFKVPEALMQAVFFPKLYGGKRDKFDNDVHTFIQEFRKIEVSVLKAIEKFSGFQWSKERIPVFLFPKTPIINYSYTKFNLEDGLPGVVQKINPDLNKDTGIFIHELCHVNQRHSDFYTGPFGVEDENGNRNEDRVELCADIVTIFVLRELFGADSIYEKAKIDFLSTTNEKNKRKYDFLMKYIDVWDLTKQPLRFYLIKSNLSK